MHWQDSNKTRHFVQLTNNSDWREFEGSRQLGEFTLHKSDATKPGELTLFDAARKLYVVLTPTEALYGQNEESIDKPLSGGEWVIKNVIVTPNAQMTSTPASTTPATTTTPDESNKIYVINRTTTVEADVGASFDLYCATRDIDNKAFLHIEWLRRGEQPLLSNMKRDKNLLQVIDFNDANEGQYECSYIKDLHIQKFVITLATKGKVTPSKKKEEAKLSIFKLILVIY